MGVNTYSLSSLCDFIVLQKEKGLNNRLIINLLINEGFDFRVIFDAMDIVYKKRLF